MVPHTTILATAATLKGIPVGSVDPRLSSPTIFSLYFEGVLGTLSSRVGVQ